MTIFIIIVKLYLFQLITQFLLIDWKVCIKKSAILKSKSVDKVDCTFIGIWKKITFQLKKDNITEIKTSEDPSQI